MRGRRPGRPDRRWWCSPAAPSSTRAMSRTRVTRPSASVATTMSPNCSGVDQPAQRLHLRAGSAPARCRRRLADGAGRDLDIVRAQRRDDVVRGQLARRRLGRDRARSASNSRARRTRWTSPTPSTRREDVLDVQVGVVGDVLLVERCRRARSGGRPASGRAMLLRTVTPMRCTSVGQARHRRSATRFCTSTWAVSTLVPELEDDGDRQVRRRRSTATTM